MGFKGNAQASITSNLQNLDATTSELGGPGMLSELSPEVLGQCTSLAHLDLSSNIIGAGEAGRLVGCWGNAQADQF